jgi:hypothetical protein
VDIDIYKLFDIYAYKLNIEKTLVKEKVEDTKGVIRSRNSKTERQCNGQRTNGQNTNHGWQKTLLSNRHEHHVTWRNGGKFMCSGRVNSSCSTISYSKVISSLNLLIMRFVDESYLFYWICYMYVT